MGRLEPHVHEWVTVDEFAGYVIRTCNCGEMDIEGPGDE